MASMRTGGGLVLAIGAIVLVVLLVLAWTFSGQRGGTARVGGTGDAGMPAATSPTGGKAAGVAAAGAPVSETAGEAADAIGAGTTPAPEGPADN